MQHQNYLKITALLIMNLIPYQSIFGSTGEHVDYVVMGKSVNYRQKNNENLILLNTVFFAEIFPTDLDSGRNKVTNAFLKGPGDANRGLAFSDSRIPFLAGQREMTIEDLNKRYPDDTYFFNFDTPNGKIRNFPVSFKSESSYTQRPESVTISLFQNEKKVDLTQIDPNQDLKIKWSNFTVGSKDPNQIIDDMIYVILGDCMGNEIDHSGHALSDPNALTFDKKEFVIKKDILLPGEPFQLEVEHSNMETSIHQNIEIIVTSATTTFLDFKTSGKSQRKLSCPKNPLAMDGGQTDRVKK